MTGDQDRSGLNKQIVGNIPIFYPSVAIQEKIANMLDSLDEKIAAEESRRLALDTLFKTLLHDLMTAKIRIDLSSTDKTN